MSLRPHGVVATIALLTAVLAGCTFTRDTGPQPTAPGSSSTSRPASPSPSAQDRSSELAAAATLPTPIATTTALSTSTYRGATFTIYRLTRDDSSTLLMWRVTPAAGSTFTDALVTRWELYPVLVAGGKKYTVVMFDGRSTNSPWKALSDPVLGLHAGEPSAPQYALYPPLPAGTTEATVQGPWFKKVTVPVTDAG